MARVCVQCGKPMQYNEEDDIFNSCFGYFNEIFLSGTVNYKKYFRQGLCGNCAYYKYQDDTEFDDDFYKDDEEGNEEEEDFA